MEVKRRLDDLKFSQMPIVSFGLISALTLTPRDGERMIHKINQDHCVTTKVPEPRHEISVASGKILGMWGIGGLSGNMNLRFGIFSLNGQLNFSVHSDTGITDDPERILDVFLESIEDLKDAVKDAQPQ